MRFARDPMDLHAFCKGSLCICMHFAKGSYGFACIVQGILMALWLCMHVARGLNGFACILQGILMELHAFCIIVQRILMALHVSCKGTLLLCMHSARDPY